MNKRLLLLWISLVIFIFLLTQYLAIQQHKRFQDREKNQLTYELNSVKDRFRGLLSNDLMAANTLAIMYKDFGLDKNFDSIAHDIVEKSRYVDAIQVTEKDIITHVYPIKGYENTIGLRLNKDSLRVWEAQRAKQKGEVFFAGPRKLRLGGVGILAKVPVVINDQVKAYTVVLTRMETIKKALQINDSSKNRFVYLLKKNVGKIDTGFYKLTNTTLKPDAGLVSAEIPEGDWTLSVAFSTNYKSEDYPFLVSILGLILTVVFGWAAYQMLRQPFLLKKEVRLKTIALANSEMYFRTIIENISDAIVLLDAEGRLVYHSQSTEKILGYSLADHSNTFFKDLLHPYDQATAKEVFQTVLEQPGSPINFNYRIVDGKGEYLFIEGAYRNLLENSNIKGVIINFRDVTEIKAERASRLKTEQRLIFTMDNMPVGCKIIDFNWKYIYINDQASKQIFKTKLEVLSHSFLEVHQLENDRSVLEKYRRYKKCMDDRCRVEFEDEFVFHNGQKKWFKYIVEPVDEGIFVMSIDMTENRKYINSLNLYNHELRLLNNINDIIILTDDENELYENVCKSIVNSGNFKLAWICIYPKDVEHPLKPIAAYGQTSYLEEIEILLTDEKHKNGPTVKALVEKKAIITNNITTAGYFIPWLEKAKKHGICSSLALPIIFEDGTNAALTIYSERCDAFNAQEFSILERLAINIGLAVSSIRTKLEKEKAKYLLGERVKELSTIYEVNKVLYNRDWSIEKILSSVVELLPPGWQYPEICAAKIHFEGADYITDNYAPSRYKQTTHFELENGKKGFIEVVYHEEKPAESEGPFFAEERYLINSIGNAIQIFLNKTYQRKAFLETEARFRSAFDFSATGMAIVSEKGEFLRVNNELCKMLGYSKEELGQMDFTMITHPEDLQKDVNAFHRLITGKIDSYRTEKRYVHKNGSIVWASLNISYVSQGDNNPGYAVSQIENITEKVEARLKFQNLVEQSLVGVYIIQNGKIVYANPKFIEESSYSEEELLASSADEFIYEEDRDLVTKHIADRINGVVNSARYQIRVRRKDGSLIWCELFGSATIYNGSPAIIGTMINVTEQRNAFQKLAASEATLKSVFDNTGVHYLLIDRSFRIITFNKSCSEEYLRLYNINLKVDSNLLDLLPAERRNLVFERYEQVYTTGKSWESEVMFDYKSDPQYYFSSLVPIYHNNEVTGIISSSINVTTRKKLELERQRIIDELLQRNRDLQQFAQIVSHNLRGPLATIMGLTNLLDEDSSAAEQKYLLEGITATATRLDMVVKDLNEVVNVKREISEAKTFVNLDELVAEIKESISLLLDESQLRISTDFSAVNQLFTVKPYINSIFYNLIVNGIKFAKPGIPPEINIKTEKSGNNFVIVFNDNGIGIDLAKNRERVFQIYQRLNPSVEGKGLGLYMTKTQVEALDGKIEVESVVGKGTTFRIILPATKGWVTQSVSGNVSVY